MIIFGRRFLVPFALLIQVMDWGGGISNVHLDEAGLQEEEVPN